MDTNVCIAYRIIEDRLKGGQVVPQLLLPEVYDDPDTPTYIDSVLQSYLDGYGATIDVWAIRNMFLSYGVSPETTERVLDRLVGPAASRG